MEESPQKHGGCGHFWIAACRFLHSTALAAIKKKSLRICAPEHVSNMLIANLREGCRQTPADVQCFESFGGKQVSGNVHRLNSSALSLLLKCSLTIYLNVFLQLDDKLE